MTNEEIQAIVNASITEALSSFREEVTTANKGLASSLTKELRKTIQNISTTNNQEDIVEDNQSTSQKLSLKALENQLSELKNQLAEKDKETSLAKRSNVVSQLIANSKALNPTALQKLFTLEYGDNIKEENGTWFVDKGDTVLPLNEALDSYLNSPEGKFYLPPSNITGTGSEEVKSITTSSNQAIDAGSALYEAFSNY